RLRRRPATGTVVTAPVSTVASPLDLAAATLLEDPPPIADCSAQALRSSVTNSPRVIFSVCSERRLDRPPRPACRRLTCRPGQLRALRAAAITHRLVTHRAASPPDPSLPSGQRGIAPFPARTVNAR